MNLNTAVRYIQGSALASNLKREFEAKAREATTCDERSKIVSEVRSMQGGSMKSYGTKSIRLS